MSVTGRWSRRSFVRALSAGAAGAAVPPGLWSTAGRSRREAPGAPDLPPRVVALRTEGGNFRFDPEGLRLDPGDSLVWLNMGDFHTATAFHPDHSKLLGQDLPLRIPEGAEPFHSGMLGLSGGTEFEHRPTVPGVYDYFCQPHYSFGMVGRFIVARAGDSSPEAYPPSDLNEASREQMPAVEAVLGPRGRAFEWASRVNGLLWSRAHRRAPGEAFRAVEAGSRDDGQLRDHLGSLDAEFRDRLRALGQALSSGTDYETLVRLADDAKAVLRRAGAAGN